MVGRSKINERLHDMTPRWISLDVGVYPKKMFWKRYNKHLILIRLPMFWLAWPKAMCVCLITCFSLRGCDHMVVRFIFMYAICVFHCPSCECNFLSRRSVLYATLCGNKHSRDFSSLPKGLVKGPFPNEKYSKIIQNFHSYSLISIPKWAIWQLKNFQNGTKSSILKTPW